jgi:hypothetical protein
LNRGFEGTEVKVVSAIKSGWMTGDDILLFVEHFVKRGTGFTKERLVLLLPGGHQTHLSVKVFDLAKESAALLLCFPYHTSHKQVRVWTFQKSVSNALDTCFRRKWGRTKITYDIPSTMRKSLSNTLILKNVKYGFLVTGL